MALIKCVECGNQISDKAEICPHCGAPVSLSIKAVSGNSESDAQNNPDDKANTIEGNREPEKVIEPYGGVQETNEVISSDGDSYSNGMPKTTDKVVAAAVSEEAEITSPKKKSKKGKIIAVIVAVVVVILAVVIGLVAYNNVQEKAARAEYIDNFKAAGNTMLQGAADAENLCNLTKSVWYNVIYEISDSETDKYTQYQFTRGDVPVFYDDFNMALQVLYADSDVKETISSIQDNKELVVEYMSLLQNPPEDMVACYEALNDLYDEYLTLTGLAINPTGSLNTFSSDFIECDNNFGTIFEKLRGMIPAE